MDNDVILDEGSDALHAAVLELEKLLSNEETFKKLQELSKRKLLRDNTYTYLDAVARQGSHVGLPTTRP